MWWFEKKGTYRLACLNTWSPIGGTAREGLRTHGLVGGGVALEEVCLE